MNDKTFLDTNVLVYCYSATEPVKQQKATDVANAPRTFISTQVVQELCNTLSKKFLRSWEEILNVVEEVSTNFPVHENVISTIQDACRIAQRYQLSFYDSLIVSAALQCNCNLLYSEDMQHGLIIDNRLTIINPFLA